MKKYIFRFLFKKEIQDLEKMESAYDSFSKLKEMSNRHKGNPLKIYRAFEDRSARCGIIMFIHDDSFDEKIKKLENRALDLMSPERLSRNDIMSEQTTFYDEIELLLIRIIVRYAKEQGRFPEYNQYILENYRDLANKRMSVYSHFVDNVINKILR